ncbi:dihydrofolate reductase family protein [Chryseolinea lacunae]|uniref:Dihydrofolate reductase n=1 Tax=Chryseolinea lacunae TaxID=2801331 RepID=A0ABS1KT99_9BACT|nr:dihydrofolate reductase family protein [Chryseolinea lacunae]MBL0742698.1 dihydrofolate reductase [Chryseolinea lacunae]
MRKIILDLAVSLDGFIEGPHGETDWCVMPDAADPGTGSPFDRFLSGIDTIFYGRVSYDLWGQYQPDTGASGEALKLWKGVHSKSKYVFTNTPTPDSDKATYITSNIAESVQAIKNKPGKDIWLYGGASLITTFINLGLIDTYQLAVHPVLLVSGKPLFANVKTRVGLTLNHVVSSKSGVILLQYDAR